MQLNKAKKVERAQALQLHEEPNGLLIHEEHIQDLNHEVVAVSYFSNYFLRLTLEYRKKLLMNWGRQDVPIDMLNYLHVSEVVLHLQGGNVVP